jgi:acetate kinase
LKKLKSLSLLRCKRILGDVSPISRRSFKKSDRRVLMRNKRISLILTINSGSSSIKFGLYSVGRVETVVLSGSVAGIGLGSGMFHVRDRDGKTMIEKHLQPVEHSEALKEIIEWLHGNPGAYHFDAVGHRLVHGGSRFSRPHLITPGLIETLHELMPFAPDHLPQEINAIEVFKRSYPDIKQVACFDTGFHRDMPRVAQIYALPGDLPREGVLRYGFHGLSYEYILSELSKEAGVEASKGRVIMAHLGNGASMVGVKSGRSMDTTMGFSPAGGLVMSTRSGDLDPGVILYLLKEKGLGFSAVNRMVNKEGGLLGVSGVSPAIKDLLDAEAKNPHAAEAVELFCYQARKFLGALIAVLGGLDTLIFTGGIGENAPSIRRRICENMEFLGIHLDPGLNDANAPIISREGSFVTVRVMKTNEELMIARHTYELLHGKATIERDRAL